MDSVGMDRQPTMQELRTLRLFLLVRLARFAALGAGGIPDRPHLTRLARHAAWSTYRDCVAVGAEAQAHALLESVARRPAAGR